MNINQLFPLNRNIVRGNPKTLGIVICIYLAICAVVKIADLLLGWIPLLGVAFMAVFWLLGLYCAVGIILAVLTYFGNN